MAWKFRLGSRREETEGTGVQVADAVPEEPVSQNVATEASTASPSTSESAATEASELAAKAEISESPNVADEAQKDETNETTEPESVTASHLSFESKA